MLGALVLHAGCGGDEPAPQHPTHKKHKKHADGDVVVTDDDSKSDDDAPKKSHRKVAETDDDAPKKKDHKKVDDDDDAPKKKTAKKDDDDDAPKKKDHKKVADVDDDSPKKKDHKKAKKDDDDANSDDDAPKKKDHKRLADDDDAPKKKLADDDDAPKKKLADDDDAKKPDDDARKTDDADDKKPDDSHPKIAERAPKKPSKRKRVAAHKAKTAPKDKAVPNGDTGAGEIEMDDEPRAGGSEQTADATGTADDSEASAAVAAPMPAPAPAVSPLAINDRALLTRQGGLEVHGGLRTAVLTLPGVMAGTSTSSTSEGLALGASYGIGAKAEVGADYMLSLHPGAVKGPLTFHGAYLAFARGKLDVAVAGALAVDFEDSTDPTTGMTTSKAAFGLELGGWVRYRVAPKVALFTGLPALPDSAASLSKLSFALPPLPYQLAIGLSGGGTIALDLPAGVGFQATPTIYAFAMTDLAHLKISNTANAFLFADFIPVTVGGFYAMKQLDLGATLGDDLKQGAGYLDFELIARYAL